MKYAATIVLLCASLAVGQQNNQPLHHALAVEDCRASHEEWNRNYWRGLTYKDLQQRSEQMGKCVSIDPKNREQYTDDSRTMDIQASMFLWDFVNRHGLMDRFNEEEILRARVNGGDRTANPSASYWEDLSA